MLNSQINNESYRQYFSWILEWQLTYLNLKIKLSEENWIISSWPAYLGKNASSWKNVRWETYKNGINTNKNIVSKSWHFNGKVGISWFRSLKSEKGCRIWIQRVEKRTKMTLLEKNWRKNAMGPSLAIIIKIWNDPNHKAGFAAFSKVLLVKIPKFAQKRIAIRFTSSFYRFIYAVRIWFLLQEVCRSIVIGDYFRRFVLNYNNLLNDGNFYSAELERGEGPGTEQWRAIYWG